MTQWYDRMAVEAEQISEELLSKISSLDAKQVLINTFISPGGWGVTNDGNEDGDLVGWTIRIPYGAMNIENILSGLICIAKGNQYDGSDEWLRELTFQAAEKVGHEYEIGSYTNLMLYFFRRGHAQDWINEMFRVVQEIEVKENE